jgi:hypothetical protein
MLISLLKSKKITRWEFQLQKHNMTFSPKSKTKKSSSSISSEECKKNPKRNINLSFTGLINNTEIDILIREKK